MKYTVLLVLVIGLLPFASAFTQEVYTVSSCLNATVTVTNLSAPITPGEYSIVGCIGNTSTNVWMCGCNQSGYSLILNTTELTINTYQFSLQYWYAGSQPVVHYSGGGGGGGGGGFPSCTHTYVNGSYVNTCPAPKNVTNQSVVNITPSKIPSDLLVNLSSNVTEDVPTHAPPYTPPNENREVISDYHAAVQKPYQLSLAKKVILGGLVILLAGVIFAVYKAVKKFRSEEE